MDLLEVLTREAREGRVDRREFMGRAGALGVAGAAAASLWSSEAKADQVQGGHFMVGMTQGGADDSLALGYTGNGWLSSCVMSFRSTLTSPKTEGGLDPELATEWGVSDDGLKWTFKLREGVEFHNGKTLDAGDVIASMNVHRGEDSTSGGKSMMDVVSDIKADGNDVVFELSSPAADFPYYLAQYMFVIAPVVDGTLDQSGVGTGPFAMEEFEPGVRAIGKRNANYFRDGRPYFDSFELLTIGDVTGVGAGVASGQLHAGWPIDPKTSGMLEEIDGVSVLSVPGGSTITMPMRADMAPFDNVDFRLAMKYMVDREQMRDRVFNGHASLANDHPVPTFDAFYNADIPQRSFDPDQAKFYLTKAGYNGETIQIHASDAAFGGAVDAGSLLAESAKLADFKLEVVREPVDGYWSSVWTQVPWCYCYWGARPTPDLILTLAYICNAAWGDTYWCDEQFTNLVVAARQENDFDKRKAMYADVQVILNERGSTVVPLFQNMVHGISDSIDTGGPVLGAQPIDTFRGYEKWSFKA